MDKIRNEEIRRGVNMQPAEQTANKNKIRLWSHVKRMASTAPQSRALVIHPVGKRPGEGHEIDGKTMFEMVRGDGDPDDRCQQRGEGETSDCIHTRRRWQKSSSKVK